MEVRWSGRGRENREYKELKANGFGPPNVMAVMIPTQSEGPGTPLPIEGERDGPATRQGPPGCLEGGAWKEGLVAENAKHGFKADEVGTTFQGSLGHVDQLTMEFLYIIEGVSTVIAPLMDGIYVLEVLGVGEVDRVGGEVPDEADEGGGEGEGYVLGCLSQDAQVR